MYFLVGALRCVSGCLSLSTLASSTSMWFWVRLLLGTFGVSCGQVLLLNHPFPGLDLKAVILGGSGKTH